MTFSPMQPGPRTPYRRMGIAVLALSGLMISIYLSLYRVGILGSIVCGPTGAGCDIVQFSPWSSIAGVPIPFIGFVAYSIILAAALMGVSARYATSGGVSRTLLVMGCCAAGFAAYNVGIEAFLIHAYCIWCLACATCALSIFALALPEVRLRRQPAIPAPSEIPEEAELTVSALR